MAVDESIVAHDIWKAFGEKQVLTGLSLTVHRGETVVILGRSGVGKSVLLKEIMGIDKPDQGTIAIDGIRISELTGRHLYEATKHVGMLFQGAALFDSMSVFDNTAFFLHQHGDPKTGKRFADDEVTRRVSEALEMVDLAGTQELMPSSLSGGMKKRAALARLIVYRPRILLYDEPTTGLDPVTSGQINRLISRTQAELKATSIVVTHDLRSALEVGDRLALHHEGQIVFIAEPDEFLKSDHPVIQSFLASAELDFHRGGQS